jgi:peptide/histidine transporter 3/4
LTFVFLLAFILGLAGFQANFIQLGLDQLFEAPSQYLSLFIHYATWAFNFGSLHFILNLYMVMHVSNERKFALVIIQVFIPLLLTVSLLISCWKRRWFLSEPGYQNPYKVVYGVFKFAKSHKHPLRRSAFTHCDNYIPSRLDFAKERFGGPFTTEQVEDVKTFIRILLVLFAVGPAFALEVPATYSRSGLVSDKALDHSSRAVNRVLHSAHALTITQVVSIAVAYFYWNT